MSPCGAVVAVQSSDADPARSLLLIVKSRKRVGKLIADTSIATMSLSAGSARTHAWIKVLDFLMRSLVAHVR